MALDNRVRPFPGFDCDQWSSKDNLVKAGGTLLYQQDNWSDHASKNRRRLIGFVAALPQVPPWMTEHFPDVMAAAASGGPGLVEFGREWFESLIWISDEDLFDMVLSRDQGRLAQFAQMDSVRLKLETPFCEGCSCTSPAVRLCQLVRENGAFSLRKSAEVFEALVDSQDERTKESDSITVVSLGKADQPETFNTQRLTAFVNLKKHRDCKGREIAVNDDVETARQRLLDAISKFIPRPSPPAAKPAL